MPSTSQEVAVGRSRYRKPKGAIRKPTPIRNVNRYDIICTQATRSVEQHQGNVWYNTIINEYAPQLGACHSVPEKNQLAKNVIARLRLEHRESRFIEPLPSTENTTSINEQQQQPHQLPQKTQLYCRVLPEKRVHDKVSHALRTRWLKVCGTNSQQLQQKQPQQQQLQNNDDLFQLSRAVATTNSGTGNAVLEVIERGDTSALRELQLDSVSNLLPTSLVFPKINNHINALQAPIDLGYPDYPDDDDGFAQDVQYFLADEEQQDRPGTPPRRECAFLAVVCHSLAMPDPIVSSNGTVRHRNNRSNIRNSANEGGNTTNRQRVLSSSSVKEEEKDIEDQRKIANRNRYYYYRRKKLKEQKQREYDLGTPEQQQQLDHEQILRRNCYYYFRRQALKMEKVQQSSILVF